MRQFLVAVAVCVALVGCDNKPSSTTTSNTDTKTEGTKTEGTKAADGSITAERIFGLPAGQGGRGRGMHGWGPPQAPASPAPSTSPSGSSGGA